MKKLNFEKPTPQTPGHLKRVKKGLEFRAKMKDRDVNDPTWLDDMVDFLADYVTEPEDRNEAKEALWDVTEEQYGDMIDAITGKQEEEGEEEKENPTADGQPSTKSEPSEKEQKQ